MKSSTKLYLAALKRFSVVVIIWLLMALFAKPIDAQLGDSLGQAFGVLTTLGWIMLTLSGVKYFKEALDCLELEKKEKRKFIYTTLERNKCRKECRKLIKKICSSEIAKEIYRSSEFSVLNVSDMFFLACPYNSVAIQAFGVTLSDKGVREIIRDDTLLFQYLAGLDNETFSKNAIVLEEENLQHIIKQIKEKLKEKPARNNNPAFAKEVIICNLYDTFGSLCTYFSIISFSVLFINEFLGFLMSIAVLILGIMSIRGKYFFCCDKYLSFDWRTARKTARKAVLGVLMAGLIIFMTIAELFAV